MIGERLTVAWLDVAMYDCVPTCYSFFCRGPVCIEAEGRSKTMKNMPDECLRDSYSAVKTFSLVDVRGEESAHHCSR